MTYDEFKLGIFYRYHFVYLKATPFIKFNVYHSDTSAVFENQTILKVDAEQVLKKLENRNMAQAFCLMAQGYPEWQVGKMIGRSERTIRRYVNKIKNDFFNNVLF